MILVMLLLVLTIVRGTGGDLYVILLFRGKGGGGSLSLLWTKGWRKNCCQCRGIHSHCAAMEISSFGRFVKYFLDLQIVDHTIRKHHQTHWQLFWLTCCNEIIPNNKISLCILPMAECSGFWYFGYFLTIWAFLSKQLTGHLYNNSHRTIKLWFNEEKLFHLIFTTYQNYPLALTDLCCV